jgi:hypothetical protein
MGPGFPGWLGKLREDQRAAMADMALIVAQALPKGLQPPTHRDRQAPRLTLTVLFVHQAGRHVNDPSRLC